MGDAPVLEWSDAGGRTILPRDLDREALLLLVLALDRAERAQDANWTRDPRHLATGRKTAAVVPDPRHDSNVMKPPCSRTTP